MKIKFIFVMVQGLLGNDFGTKIFKILRGGGWTNLLGHYGEIFSRVFLENLLILQEL